MSTTATTPTTLTNLSTLLPTGSYLAFSILVPITTNNGNCGLAEKIATGVVVFIFTFLCAFLVFTDSYVADNGKVYYGVVTYKGLWNPFFSTSTIPNLSGWTYVGEGTKYNLTLADFVISVVSVISFLTLILLSPELTGCYYKGINDTTLKAIPLAVNFFVGVALSFVPKARHGVGFAFTKTTTAAASNSVSSTTAVETDVQTDKKSSELIIPVSEESVQA